MADELPASFLAALGDLPIFPLPHVVFFPGMVMPLHVFEPRYRALARHCLDTHRSMAVAMLLPGPPDASGNPPLVHISGAGLIVDHEALPDGRFNLLLRGESRVALEEHPFSPPFRRARAEPLPDLDEPVLPRGLAALVSLATSYAADLKLKNPSFEFHLPPPVPPHHIPDLVAAQLFSPELQQRILEERSPRARVDFALSELALMRRPPGRSGAPS